MSQYGAYGLRPARLERRRDPRATTTPGTALGHDRPGRNGPRPLIAGDRRRADLSGARQAGSRKLDPAVDLHASGAAGSRRSTCCRAAGRRLATFTAPLQVAGPDGVTTLGGKGSYRGVLEFKPDGVQGPVGDQRGRRSTTTCRASSPAESPASWPAEALKAQAIAARTYAITTAKSADFDHYADTRSQVYNGVGVETASTNAAVADTRGQVVTYQGQPVVTYFFSTSGGQHRVGREHDARHRAEAVAEVGRRRVRRRLAAPSLDDEADDGAGRRRSSAGSCRGRSAASG